MSNFPLALVFPTKYLRTSLRITCSKIGRILKLILMCSDDDEPPSCSDYVLHLVTVFWKIIFAFVPPTGKDLYSVTLTACCDAL